MKLLRKEGQAVRLAGRRVIAEVGAGEWSGRGGRSSNEVRPGVALRPLLMFPTPLENSVSCLPFCLGAS